MSQIFFPKAEEEILEFWEQNKIFEKTLSKDSPQGEFVFYEGPPTANGKPGIHHVLARAFKDLIPRYKTMRGYRVVRKAGWDTHGLPVELEVEKQLNISGKPEIEKYGIEEFNYQCRLSVWRYKEEWERLTKRIGFWLDLEHPYITYHNDYIETLWWIIKQADSKGLLYQGYKVVPHCPRCGTALSSHEVAQGYREVPDRSVYIKFRVNKGNAKVKSGDYILSWTTTPWTLPGNVALAVGAEVEYLRVRREQGKEEEFLIVAKNLVSKVLGEDFEELDSFSGSELVGLTYEPLFVGAIPKNIENFTNAFRVYAADFVTVEDGTGVVHTAVMYGEDDYQLGEEVGLPRFHTVDESGSFSFPDLSVPILADLNGKFVKNEATEDLIINYLQNEKLLLKEEIYRHDYPFCWRCDTPLLYYAKDSWFIAMSELREKLKDNNQQINWVPGHIKTGRFGEWLEGVKDWAISRERYWGTPLPVWECSKCSARTVVGSRQELYEQAVNKPTKIIFVRHGESEKNLGEIYSAAEQGYPLTEVGEKQAEMYAKLFQGEEIGAIYSSPTLRARQTAEIIANKLGQEFKVDNRLQEIYTGEWEDKSKDELRGDDDFKKYLEMLQSSDDKIMKLHQGKTGESWQEVTERTVDFIKEISKAQAGKTIIVVTHQVNMVMFSSYLWKLTTKEIIKLFSDNRYQVGVKPLVFYLEGDLRELDLHRPFIDQYQLACLKCGGEMQRQTAVLDCWFDSGSMPFAQVHYPFVNRELIEEGKLYPADFISEAIDQTRGWFYTLLAVATMLGLGNPYKNVICLGHINDKHGKKMSKSKGNIVDPWEIINSYGVDALRLHLYTMNQPGEPKNFDARSVQDVLKKNFIVLWNVLSFYQMYSKGNADFKASNSGQVLDRWIVARFKKLALVVTSGLENYDVTGSGRAIIGFINELSTWYIRRSRGRFKAGGKEGEEAWKTLGWVLWQLAKIMAPFTPLLAEKLYQELCSDLSNREGFEESVHLSAWPDDLELDKQAEADLVNMEKVRRIVEEALSLRAQAGLKIRQPLARLEISEKELAPEFVEIIREEVNVKEVVTGCDSVVLDTNLNEELRMEGLLREVVRQVNSLRKQARLTIEDRIILLFDSNSDLANRMLKSFAEELKQSTLATEIKEGKTAMAEFSQDLLVDDGKVNLGILKDNS